MPEVWKPWPKQELALKTVAFEILYGGARGPGKTDAGIVWMQKPVSHPRYRGLVIRKNSKDLSDWVDRAKWMYSGHRVETVGNPPEFRFRSGAKILTGHLKDKNAYEQFQGHEYQRMLLEELTQIPDEERYLKLISSCRSTIDGLDARVFNTTNPLGLGHMWVKKRFVDVAPPLTKYVDPITGKTRIFIPGTIEDNPTLLEKDPSYLDFLNGLPETLRKAWRDGSWDVLAGQFFNEFDRDHHIYDPAKIKIQPSWPRFRSIDWGFSSPMAVYWHAIGPDQHIYTYRELYVTEMLDVDCAKKVVELTGSEKIQYTVGDPQSFPVRIPHYKFGELQAIPRAQVWAENGVPIIMGTSDRVPGWSLMREYLKLRPYMGQKSSWWHISSQCPNLIEELGSAIYSDKNPEDVHDESKDHGLESCRLGLMSRPRLWQKDKEPISHLEAAERQARREEAQEGYSIGFR